MEKWIWALPMFLLISCQQRPMQAEQKRVIEDYIQAYNRFDADGMIQHLHPSVVFKNITNGQTDLQTEGLPAFRQQAEQAKQYFRHRRQTITAWEFTGDTVTIEIDYEGQLAVDLPNGLRAGDTLRLSGQSVFVFEGDRIVALTDKS
ncbi:nuclear transport factor 2 family protein [Phaeodactylibacter xiamenensis]|uniref:nuclear transport factor 2 family protein n=1 Tax=Phaeodactylibacter xiamenensis TaxID=1524460 RepID=UPI003CCC3FE9